MFINKLRRKSSLKEFQGQLEKEKSKLEERLKNLIAPDQSVFNEMPDFGGEVSDESIEADQIEEIGNVLALRQILENDLKNIDEALERIKNGAYGICRRCQKEIELKRLRVEPAATLCSKCVKKIEKLD
ncbi:MAG: TraR/DksA C4-type zinc finger protein [bacterium]|nr:TraR/DksA C4-type zinc finger protein [bacterium]